MQESLKEKVVFLRQEGLTYSEIARLLNTKIPKSTISYWCKSIVLTRAQKNKIDIIVKENLKKSREKAIIANKIKRRNYLLSLKLKNNYLGKIIEDSEMAKVSLAILYLTEGSKTRKGSAMFGNSDPCIVRLFLKLLRKCYDIDESKFRCTLQGRADQDISKLEKYWSEITNIPLKQFYKARIDARTINSVSRNKEYKGVCRIDYFSAHVYNELKIIANIIYEGL